MWKGTRVVTMFIVAILMTSFAPQAISAEPLFCLAPDRGDGTVEGPITSCFYVNDPDEPWNIIDGLSPGDTILIDVLLHDYDNIVISPGGGLGGEIEESSPALLQLSMQGTGTLASFNRNIFMQVQMEADTAPRTLGDSVQTFPNDMVRLEGSIFGDPDFDELHIRAGSDLGLPSPGQTTLTELPSGDFVVDSFFDVFYEIQFIGAPGSILDSFRGTTQGTSTIEELGMCFADLDGAQMVPPVVTGASGAAQLTFDPGTNVFGWNPISFADLTTEATTIFIHGPAPPNVNSGVQVDVGLLSGGVPAATTGEITGSAFIDDTQKSDLLNELWYIVVRNAEFPAGEIRGQIICEVFHPVGGTILPIDSFALLLAGTQMTASWLIPVLVAGAGIGLICIRKWV